MGVPSNFNTKVVGISFVKGYPENVHRLNDIASRRYLAASTDEVEPIPAILIRNPDNEFDSNCIEVHVPAMGDAAFLGHIPANLAARLAPSMDAGDTWRAAIRMVAVHPDHPLNPGVHLSVERVDV